MRFDELILARRSVRKYQTKAVEPEKLQALIEAVRMAPSASNAQPWKLILVDDARKGVRLRPGILADIAPTILKILGLNQPAEMTGKSLTEL